MTALDGVRRGFALALSGGMALGAYQAGALAVLFGSTGRRPDWVCGTSVGAVNAAIAVGTAPESVGARLRDFWFAASDDVAPYLATPMAEWTSARFGEARRSASVMESLIFGRAGLFLPRMAQTMLGLGQPGLYSLEPLRSRLQSLIDFDRLNNGPVRYTATATNIVAGEQVVFDTARGDVITADHLIASSAMLPVFAPVELEGQLLGDGGLIANMPVSVILEEWATQPLTSILIDLMPQRGSRPDTLAEAAARAADIAFSSKTWTALAAAQREFEVREQLAEASRSGAFKPPRPLGFAVLEYPLGPAEAGVAKIFDYSRQTLEARWRAGALGITEALGLCEELDQATGFRVLRTAGGTASGHRDGEEDAS